MKLLGWILILAGITMVIIKGMHANPDATRNPTALIVLNDERDLIGWQTYVGGVISIIGIILLASCEGSKPKRN